MRFIIMKLPTPIKLGIAGLAFLGLILAVMTLGYGFVKEAPTGPRVASEDFFIRPDMTVTIPIIFNVENPAAIYDWALVADDDNTDDETFVETTYFELRGQSYEFLLATRKDAPSDEGYTVPDYIALTLAVPNDQAVTDTIVYIDLGADNNLDAVYLNDVQITAPEAIIVAQEQYTTELVVARNHMLDSVSL